MGIDYRWVVDEVTGRYRWVSYTGRQVVDEVTDGYRWVSYAGRRNRHIVPIFGGSTPFFSCCPIIVYILGSYHALPLNPDFWVDLRAQMIAPPLPPR